MNAFELEVMRIPGHADAAALFERVFGLDAAAFLFESSLVVPGFSRFTFMGDAHGRYGERITYDVRTRTATVHTGGNARAQRVESIFDFLEARLARRTITCRTPLPFGFDLGYAGVFGYEVKAETIGAHPHRSAVADAAFLFATRMLVIDHAADETYLLHLVDDDVSREEARAWFESACATIAALRAKSEDEAAPHAAQRRKLALEEVQAWIAAHAEIRHPRHTYVNKIGEALREILHGESYEICLTNSITFKYRERPFALYRAMRALSPAPHAAYFNAGEFALVSASPERFLCVDRQRVAEAKPIKGTRPRGRTPDEDAAFAQQLRTSEKDRAENLMIVDLLRNDLGQVCEMGSVHVPKLFDVETYSHVHQLVSTVRGTLKPGVSSVGCIRATFPGGSMTGAPKKRTMEIIDRLEQGPRGIYSGALGWFGTSGACDFSIVIRSVAISAGTAHLGVGGAITALSDPDEEFDETMVKARGIVEAVEHVWAGGS
ncbi:aminodeoxychorismate synthase component I [Trinickia diaoshuihuensis]|uniref:aminodeoxychorismate synthase component I n=1 Tax=Trinickia diaoshuihuensis TaxID=2292265 RepID=UPI001968A213|nr:aminodeoxychorismate synthase component I [Trinickia diaoshuihuensis]